MAGGGTLAGGAGALEGGTGAGVVDVAGGAEAGAVETPVAGGGTGAGVVGGAGAGAVETAIGS